MNYYNEWDKPTGEWLRELIAEGLIPEGDVDERSIVDVRGSDLAGYVQCHFFAGIGGWPYALQLAGWPADRTVWTGSCPCQPFSTAAGKRTGTADSRHIWPEFHRLIAECRPAEVFGEQVASKDGRVWLSAVRTDMETSGYAVGCANLCAAGVGAPHIRQRLFWVGHARAERLQGELEAGSTERATERTCDVIRLADAERDGGRADQPGRQAQGRTFGGWDSAEYIPCRDGTARPVEPGLSPLAYGVSARVVRLRGYGNAIVPQVAAEFIAAYLEVEEQGGAHESHGI